MLPDLIAKRAAEKKLTIWCGAASTGQEIYSVLILINENFPDLFNWDFKFIGTDICTEVLAKARAGRFSQLEVNRGLPAPLLVKYFTRQGSEWEVRADLRKRVELRELNLVKDWPWMPALDIVFLRNVLIYFDVETKRSILGRIRRNLKPDGYLFLGGAETTLNVDDAFERVMLEKTTTYKVRSHDRQPPTNQEYP